MMDFEGTLAEHMARFKTYSANANSYSVSEERCKVYASLAEAESRIIVALIAKM